MGREAREKWPLHVKLKTGASLWELTGNLSTFDNGNVDDIVSLKNKIKLLEKEVELKNRDLETYRKEIIKANQQIEDLILHIHSQLKKALEIQRQVVPTEFPNIPGFEFSTKFMASSLTGGDYFDIFEHRDRMQFGILLSSASGYSLSASFLSLFMKFTFPVNTDPQAHAPASLLSTIAQELVPQMDTKERFHIFYGVMNRRTLRLDFMNIGDTVGLQYSQDTKNLKRLQFGLAPVSSSFAKTSVEVQSLDFDPKDKLILCSPGLFKISNAAGEFFGEERYYSIIKKSAQSDVHNLRNEIFFQIQQFTQGSPLPQDLTVIVVEVKDRVLKLASI